MPAQAGIHDFEGRTCCGRKVVDARLRGHDTGGCDVQGELPATGPAPRQRGVQSISRTLLI